jgi:ABC-2 type transport system permease protein
LNKFKRAIVGFFAGSLLPLDFFPLWLRQIAAALPFQGIYYIPLTLVTGLRDYKAVWSQVLLQMFWVVILSVLSYLLWSQAIKRVTIQGG